MFASHRGDSPKVELLRGAVVGYECATKPLSRVATQGLSFQQLYGEFVSSLQLRIEAETAASKDGSFKESLVSPAVPRIMPANILFASQGMNRNANTSVRASSVSAGRGNEGGASRVRFDPLTVAGCFNCDHPGHTLKDCKQPMNTTQQAK